MNFGELYAEVVAITKRPDLQARTEGAIKAATQKMHMADFFYKDLVEVPVQFSEELFIQNFIPTEVLPQFRKVKYIRFWHGDIDGRVGKFLEPIQIENAVDGYGYHRENVFYMAGQMLQTRTCPAVSRVLFGAYVNPIIAPTDKFSSWIANEVPYAIIYEAARTVFRSISLQEQAQEYQRLTMEIVAEMRMSYVDDVPLT